MIITFCGHSTYSHCQKDEETLLNLLEKVACGKQVDFLLGGYGGFDSFARKCVKKYKENHGNAKIIFVSPYLNKWLDDRKEMLKNYYDEIIYPQLESVPLKFAIIKRNEWMVDQADYVFCYVNCHYGGAYRTLLYTKRRKKPYINLYQGKYEI